MAEVPGGEAGAGTFRASVPIRPSPMLPAVDAPTGGVTPVMGRGNAGATGLPGLVAEPRPDGVVPGSGIPGA